MKEKEEIIALWKKLGVDRVDFEFSCGGDSMNDTELYIYDKNDNTIDNDDIKNYFEDEIYNNVEFYEASDGHYQGEMGNVEITLEAGEEDFMYSKSSQSEWSEMLENIIEIELNDEQAKFVREKVLNINGGEGESCVINFKQDCILTDKEEDILKEIEDLVESETSDFSPDEYDGELRDYYTYTTNDEGEELKLDGNVLNVEIRNEVTIWRDE